MSGNSINQQITQVHMLLLEKKYKSTVLKHSMNIINPYYLDVRPRSKWFFQVIFTHEYFYDRDIFGLGQLLYKN